MTGHPLQKLLDDGVESGAFPSVRAEVCLGGKRVFSGGVGPEDALYDLASLTKVISTSALFVSLWRDGAIAPETGLRRFFPHSPAADSALADLLAHRSGLPNFRPFFADVFRRWPELLAGDCPSPLRLAARVAMVDAAAATSLETRLGAAVVYSDVGFMLLGEVLASVAGRGLDQLFTERVAGPLGLSAHFRPLSSPPPAGHLLQPTGDQRPREPAPGQEASWSDIAPAPSRAGEVDDDNAWAMDGVAGHTGLFGSAGDVARFGVAILEELQGANLFGTVTQWERMLTRDAQTPDSTRALGFDTPSAEGSSAGAFIGKRAPGAFGHTGFTGTSLWVDRARDLVVALCTNRTSRGRANVQIQSFRPRFHDAVVKTLGL